MAAPFKLRINRLFTIVGIWTLIGVFMTLYDYLLLQSNLADGVGKEYSFISSLGINLFAGFTGGMLGGFVLEYYNHQNRSRPYIYGLLIVAAYFILIVIFITIIISIIPTLYFYGNPLTNAEAKEYLISWLWTTLHLKNTLFWAAVVILTLFSIQISDKFGPRNLWRILTGQYHMPKKEERIFMFLDLKSSTTIAEKLGEENYHEFLKDVFADITDPIMNNQAEIYQYVGDEVVVSWSLHRVKDKKQPLNCFYDIQEELQQQTEKYKQKYGWFPQFKAGAHLGQVIAGEVGIIKRDITYSGDVLNTCARIQGKCNELEASLLISEILGNYVGPNTAPFTFKAKGHIDLKGKEAPVALLAVERN